MNFREKRAESQQVEDKYLDVLEHAKTNDVMVARLGYREVATHYGCAYTNDGYRVMEEMADRVPGVTYKTSRTLSVDDAMDVGGHHIEITFANPDLEMLPTAAGNFWGLMNYIEIDIFRFSHCDCRHPNTPSLPSQMFRKS
ncbi:hypothetical protein SAMN05421858_4896 [Haladaptatus litoreus]|uniref:Uncharacterized protein n=1 Tax=Haladaptatus litoreus TaxID=553468 RepID=A0A1N7FAW6_9EURY|nr:hypothetical protein [Haladaptatus litoreus]SIR97528.1 hypothetical protein SAMN05421858_4896 [Haladaptatus litoreus]